MPRRLAKNKVQPVESQPPPPQREEAERRVFQELEKDDEGKFEQDLNLDLDSLNLTRQKEASFEEKKQKEQDKVSVEKKKEEVEGLTRMEKKLTAMTNESLKRLTNHFKLYGIGHDEDFFSKQIQELEQKFDSLKKEIGEIEGEIQKKEQEIGEMSGQQGIIDLLKNYNKLVRVNNKMKDDYDQMISQTNKFSPNLQPLFDRQQKDIGDIKELPEVEIPDDETERKNLYEKIKGEGLPSINEKTKDIIDKFTNLQLLIDKFDGYLPAENELDDSFREIMKEKKAVDEYKQKKKHIETLEAELKETLNLDEDQFEKYAEALPLTFIRFMNKISQIEIHYQDAELNFEEATKKFNDAKSKLTKSIGIGELEFVKTMKTEIERVEYDGDVKSEFINIGDLKEDINKTLNDSVKRLICTSFINGIQESNLTNYNADENGKEYLIAYIYTLAYNLGKGRFPDVFERFPGGFMLPPVTPRITEDEKQKVNGIGALTIEEIISLKVDNFSEESLNGLQDLVFGNLKLLKTEHFAFLENYNKKVDRDDNVLLMNIFNSIVADALGDNYNVDYLANLQNDIEPFYKEIIKTEEEREEEAAKRFTEDEFNYYLSEPPDQWNELFRKMVEFKSRYTGVYNQKPLLRQIVEIQQGLGERISEFMKPYIDKQLSNKGQDPEKPGDDDEYITSDHYESLKVFLTIPIPIPDDNVDFNDIINMDEPLTHAVVLSRIIKNISKILNFKDSETLYNFKSWFFKENSIRSALSQNFGTEAFENTLWYKNHIEKLEIFLEHNIQKRVDHIINVQGRYKMPLIDPTKFEDWNESKEKCFTIKFLEYLLGDDFSRILIPNSWKSETGEDMERENWDNEWMKKRLNNRSEPTEAADIPLSYVTRDAEEICSAFKRFINESNDKFSRRYREGKDTLKRTMNYLFHENAAQRAGMSGTRKGQACVAVNSVFQNIMIDADKVNYCERFDESQATGGSQKRRKDTRRKRKDTRRKRKDTRRKKKDTRRKRKDTRRKLRKDTRRKTRK